MTDYGTRDEAFAHSPVKTRMYRLLADGRPHTRAELAGCLDDDMAGPSAVWFHVSQMRVILRRWQQTVFVHQIAGVNHYQLVTVTPHQPVETKAPSTSN